MASYRVLLYSADKAGDWAPLDLVAEVENPKYLGYAYYLNDIPEAFWTMPQYDSKVALKSYLGTGHVVVLRNNEVVWRGILSEWDSDADDVIMYAYGYEHVLFHLLTTWNKKWDGKKIAGAAGRPIDDLIARAIAINDSQLSFATVGTTQAPVTTSGGSTDITLGKYNVKWKPIISAMRELTAIATSDTDNTVFMEFDYPTDPTDLSLVFNYWKNKSTDRTTPRLELPGNMLSFQDVLAPVIKRNKSYAVASGPRGQLYRYVKSEADGVYGRTNFGNHQTQQFLSWVRDRKELVRITKRRLKLGLIDESDFAVRMLPDAIEPARSSTSGYNIGDRLITKVSRGATQINKYLVVMGEQVLVNNGREYVQPILDQRALLDETDYAGMKFQGATDGDMNSEGEFWVDSFTGSGNVYNKTVTLDDGDTIALVPFGGGAGYNTITAITLDGVAGTLVGGHLALLVPGDYYSGIYAWYGSDVPAGQTVTLSITTRSFGGSRVLAYGLAHGSSAAAPTGLYSSSKEEAASGTIGGDNISSSTTEVFSVLNSHTATQLAATTGFTRLATTPVTTYNQQAFYVENLATTGNRTLIGAGGNSLHVSVNAMFYNQGAP